MGSTESVKEIDERKMAFQSCTVCNRSQIHNFLHRRLAEHCCACLAACIHIRMISEDVQRMGCHATCRYIEYARKPLAGNLVKIRNHQQQSLGCRIGGSQSACCQGAMHRSCCTCFGLHLSNLYSLSENILSSLGCPFVRSFCHNG